MSLVSLWAEVVGGRWPRHRETAAKPQYRWYGDKRDFYDLTTIFAVSEATLSREIAGRSCLCALHDVLDAKPI